MNIKDNEECKVANNAFEKYVWVFQTGIWNTPFHSFVSAPPFQCCGHSVPLSYSCLFSAGSLELVNNYLPLCFSHYNILRQSDSGIMTFLFLTDAAGITRHFEITA
jgi:hypothetical protein